MTTVASTAAGIFYTLTIGGVGQHNALLLRLDRWHGLCPNQYGNKMYGLMPYMMIKKNLYSK